jgi:hypothetical protein
MTLQTKRGNAMDTASLLIAILRAAGIPARYAYGTVQMPIDKAMNWVGGVTVPEAAANLMQQGGIPTSLVATNGVITQIKFEHTWVEAWVDYEPSRGMKNIEGDNWIPMDASYKLFNYEEIHQESNPDIKTTISSARELNVQPLASGLPYQLVVKSQNLSVLPDGFEWKYKAVIRSTEGNEVISWTTTLSEISGKTLGLAFAASDSSSQQVLDDYKYSTQGLPGYLINLKAEWVKNSEVVQTGGSFKMGDEIMVVQQLYQPGVGWDLASDSVASAGEYHGIVIDTGNDTPDSLNTYYEPVNRFKSSAHNYKVNGVNDGYINKYTFGSAWYSSIIKNYFVGNAIYDVQQAAGMGVVSYRLPSYGIFKSSLDTRYYFGIPRSVFFLGFTTDIDSLRFQSVSKDNNQDTVKKFMLSMGFRYSFLEGEIPSQIISGMDKAAQGFSAVDLLGMAKDQGQKIIVMTQADMSSLNDIVAPSEVIEDMRNALYAGKEVTAHPLPIAINGKSLSGYLIVDPITGSGAYRISTGQNGAVLFAAADRTIHELWINANETSDNIYGFLNDPESQADLISAYGTLLTQTIAIIFPLAGSVSAGMKVASCLRLLSDDNTYFVTRFVAHYYCGNGADVDLKSWGLGYFINNAKDVKDVIDFLVTDIVSSGANKTIRKLVNLTYEKNLFSIGHTWLTVSGSCADKSCTVNIAIKLDDEWFRDPLDIGQKIQSKIGSAYPIFIEIPFGTPYREYYDDNLEVIIK